MKNQIKLFVVLPCYNEAQNIEKVVRDFKFTYMWHMFVKLEFVLINDGSSDDTLEICELLKREHERITVIDHVVNQGLGAAVKTGINHVLKIADIKDLLVILDSDYTHKAVYSLDMVRKAMEGCDVVIASRFFNNSKIYGVPMHRVLLSVFARWYYTIMFNIPNVKDYTCGYRVYRMPMLKKMKEIYGDNIVEESGFSCMCELLVKLNHIGAIFGESTFELYYGDKGGVSSMKILKTIKNSLRMPIKFMAYKSVYKNMRVANGRMQVDIETEIV